MSSEILTALFRKNHYSVNFSDRGFTVRNEAFFHRGASIFLALTGLVVAAFSVATGSWKLGLLAIILIGIPFTSRKWKMPLGVSFSRIRDQVVIRTWYGKEVITPLDKPELLVNYHYRTSFVSPFEEGYKDHYYTFQLATSRGNHNLFQIKTREKQDETIGKLVNYISKLNIWKK